MDRRELLGVLGTTTAGLLAVGGAVLRPGTPSGAQASQRVRTRTVSEACQESARACSETFHHCYEQLAEGKKEHAMVAAPGRRLCQVLQPVIRPRGQRQLADDSLLPPLCAPRRARRARPSATSSGGAEMKDCAKVVSRLREDVPGDGPRPWADTTVRCGVTRRQVHSPARYYRSRKEAGLDYK